MDEFQAFVAQAWPRLLRSAWLLTGTVKSYTSRALATLRTDERLRNVLSEEARS